MRRIICAAFLFVPAVFGQYTYYYTDAFSSIDGNWTQNGSVSGGSSGLTATSSSGGSVISTLSVPYTSPATPEYYEVKATFNFTNSGGTYAIYLDASSNAKSGPSAAGTFYSIELTPTVSSGSCSATLVLNKSVSGSITQIISFPVTCATTTVVRAVRTLNPFANVFAIYVNNVFVWDGSDSTITSGQPGVGGWNMPSGNSIESASLGQLDVVAPYAINRDTIGVTAFANQVNLQWGGTTDNLPNGVGLAFYEIFRNSTFIGLIPAGYENTFTDDDVSPSTTYTYTFYGFDWHLNYSALAYTVSTPPSGAIDPRRVGVRTTGAYWGASPEQIDVLSGNLSYSLPLLQAKGRSASVGFSLSYNSQNWRQDPGGVWNLGRDVGYGYGWQLLAGSITPYWTGYFTVDHYTFTDSTGAQYVLNVNNGSNVWSSSQSVYVQYDANAQVLHFPDGTFWTFGCQSAGSEQDAGTLYPTVMEDTNGNQILINYAAGLNVTWTNSSARITTIEDVRATNPESVYYTYAFAYNGDSIPHLTSITNSIGTGEEYNFSYSGFTLTDPFTSTSFGTSTALSTVTLPLDSDANYQFTSDSTGALTKAKLIYGGYIRWTYVPFTYNGSRVQEEIGTRYLSPTGMSGSELAYPFGHESDSGTENVHSYTYVDDAGGVGQKSWAFSQSGSNIGLATLYHGTDLSVGAVKIQNLYTWTQDSAGNNYVGTVVTSLDSTSVSTTTTQTLDTNGNVLQVVKYNYPDLSPASLTYTYAYLNSSAYTSRYIFNRLTSATVTDGTNNATLATIAYDWEQGCGYGCIPPGSSPNPREWDTTYASTGWRGNPTSIGTPSGATANVYDRYGNVSSTTVNGITSTVSTTSTTNYAAPSQITVGSSLTTSLTYDNSFLGLTNETGPNGTSVDIGYDANARPASSTSPFGATTSTSYNDTASPPNTCTMVNGRWTQTNLDGLGRPILTITGYGSSCGSGTFLSQAETTYGSCGCSPLGKMMSQAVPHAYGTEPSAVTTYSYDGIGRTISKAVVGAETQGTTTYAYYGQPFGEQVNVYDPVGNWKVFYTDAFGNLSEVTEPNPYGGANYNTSYTYDPLGHLTGVTMPRPTGTQTRSFSYSGNFLMSATNPENGTVTYTYNGYNKVATRTDAKGQEVVYSYDSYARLNEVQRYPSGISGGEDTCQRETYYYDGTTPNGSTYPQDAVGHLSAVQYMGGHNPNFSTNQCDTTFTELYNYGTPGAPVGKELLVTRTLQQSGVGWSPYTVTLAATFAYDNEGRMTQETYPTDNSGTTANLSYTFDSMGRLNTMTDNVAMQQVITGATYGPANELTSITGGSYYGAWAGETRGYNSLKQLIGITSGSVGVSYAYPATGNNGKISSQTDAVSGETVTYTYDVLNRLATAENQTSFSPSWGQGFTYDGFGNLTNVSVIQGSAPTFTATYDANNHGGDEDANGNPGYVPLPAFGTSVPATYDVENRLVGINGAADNPVMYYSHAPDNKRLWRGTWTYSGGDWTVGTDEVTFWNLSGQRLGSYALTTISGTTSTPQFYATQVETHFYFGTKLIKNANGWVYTDRLASVGKFYPYGVERPSATANGTEKFTGYFRDAESGNDYAVNRYMMPGYGRFITPDRKSGHLTDPSTWNKYAYVGGDPINRRDPQGRDYEICDESGNCQPVYTSETDEYDIEGAEDDSSTPCAGEGDDLSDWCVAWLDYIPGFGSGISNLQVPGVAGLSGAPGVFNFSLLVTIQGTLDNALSDPKCASLFGTQGSLSSLMFGSVTAAQVLNSLIAGNSPYGSIQFTGRPLSMGAEGQTNSSSSLKSLLGIPTSSTIIISSLSVGSSFNTSFYNAEVLVLHELGHLLANLGFSNDQITPDGLDPSGNASSKNTAKIASACAQDLSQP